MSSGILPQLQMDTMQPILESLIQTLMELVMEQNISDYSIGGDSTKLSLH